MEARDSGSIVVESVVLVKAHIRTTAPDREKFNNTTTTKGFSPRVSAISMPEVDLQMAGRCAVALAKDETRKTSMHWDGEVES